MDDIVSLTDILAVLRRRFWIIFIVVVLAVGAAAVLSYIVLPPVYQANTSLIVNQRSSVTAGSGGVDYGQIQTSQALALIYAKIITSRAVLQDTIDTLGMSETTKQLAKMTTVQVGDQTGIISVSVRDRDTGRAALIANALAGSFIGQLPRLVNQVENVSVIDRAIPVTDQVSPHPLLNIAVALVASLTLGVLLAFLVDYFDDTVKTSEDVKKRFGLRVLALVPDTRKGGLGTALPLRTGGSGSYEGSHTQAAEAFRVLRTNLQFAAVDKELKVVLVTSVSAHEGKSTIVQFLAEAIAQTGKKVMALDADLISPSLHLGFAVPNQRGLSNLIVGDADFSVAAPLKDHPNLSVITTGPVPPNSSELLGSARMKHLMDRLREEYDVIIMDTPPILPVTDAVVASSLADGVILVVQAGRTRGGEVRRTQEMLEEAHANLLGVVLNRVRRRSDHYYASAYYQ